MTVHRESRLLPFPCEQLFRLVLDIECYPDFVPGYSAARVLRREAAALEVEQSIGVGPAAVSFRSRAEFEPVRYISIQVVDGPFRRLQVEWRFTPHGAGCRVGFAVGYALQGPLVPLLGPWLEVTAPRLLDAFVRRAAVLYSAPDASQ